MESRIIEQLVWQWWMDKNSGQWLVVSGEEKQQQIPRRDAPRNDSVLGQAGGQRNRRVSQNEALRYQGEQQKRQKQVPHRHPAKPAGWVRDDKFGSPWAKYRVARLLGVSHTWVNKLVKRIEADPERMRRKMRAFAPASFEKLERAREETRRERERGLLRGPIRWRRVKVTLEGKKKKIVAVARAARLRQGYGAASPPERRGGYGEAGPFGAAPVRYSELPQWARGLPLPGGTGIAALPLSGPFVPQGKQAGGRGPRPVPFAFRRRR